MIQNAPWLKHYGDVPKSLDYPDTSMSELVLQSAEKYPDAVPYVFFGSKVSYSGLNTATLRRKRSSVRSVSGPRKGRGRKDAPIINKARRKAGFQTIYSLSDGRFFYRHIVSVLKSCCRNPA